MLASMDVPDGTYQLVSPCHGAPIEGMTVEMENGYAQEWLREGAPIADAIHTRLLPCPCGAIFDAVDETAIGERIR
jgi:hypothetical protein